MDKLKEEKIITLLSSFYDGSIGQESLEELSVLLEEEGDALPAHLQDDREVIREWRSASSCSLSPMPIESEMAALRLIEELASADRRKKRMSLRWICVAAVAALLVAIGVVAVFVANPKLEQRDALAKENVDNAPLITKTDSMISVRPVAPAPKPLIAKDEKVGKENVKKPRRNKTKRTELSEEEKIARDIAEVQALLDAIAAEWDNADRGVRGLLTNRGMLANADIEEEKSEESQDK